MNDLSAGKGVVPHLSAQMLERVQQPIESSRGLPNEVYTDSAVFDLERKEIFGKSWTAIGFATDVPERGSAMPVSLAGIPLMMLRGRDETLRVFHNVCRHRGHPLVSEKCKLKGSIVCPYHAWTYNLEGELKGTPNIGGAGVNDYEGFDKNEYGLNEVRSHVWMDVVFVDLSGELAPFDEHFKTLMDRWEPYWGKNGEKNFHYPQSHADIEFSLNTNWKFPVENYVESYHLPCLHPELNSYSRIEDHYHIMEGDLFGGQGSLVYDFAGQAGITMPTLDGWPEEQKQVAEYVAIYPNLLVGIQVDHIYAVIVMPKTFEQTTERFRIYTLDESTGPDYEPQRKIIRDGWELVFAQDVTAVEGMQASRHSPAYDGGVFSPVLDNPTHHFHNWVARRLAA